MQGCHVEARWVWDAADHRGSEATSARSNAQLAIAHEKREGIGALQFAGLQQASKQTNETMPVSND